MNVYVVYLFIEVIINVPPVNFTFYGALRLMVSNIRGMIVGYLRHCLQSKLIGYCVIHGKAKTLDHVS